MTKSVLVPVELCKKIVDAIYLHESEGIRYPDFYHDVDKFSDMLEAAPKQEPVGWIWYSHGCTNFTAGTHHKEVLESDGVKMIPVCAAPPAPEPGWIKCSERMPDRECLAFYVDDFGKGRIIKAKYVAKHSISTDCADYEGDSDYCEEDDECYWPEGWYESIEQAHEFGYILLEEKATHWMPLPAPPEKADD